MFGPSNLMENHHLFIGDSNLIAISTIRDYY